MLAFVIAAFLSDIVLKIVSRAAPAIAGRFSYTSSIGDFGIVPSTNDVLAFSLPISNAWIWPVGWIVVAWLVAMLLWNAKCLSRGASAEWGKMLVPRSFSGVGQNAKNQIALFAIILGAISNLIDRTVFGGVTDYFSFSDLYPAFNIADLLIITGIVWWIYAEKTRST